MSKPRNASKYEAHVSNMQAHFRIGYTVYALWCPVSKRIKYIGYTHANPCARLQSHLSKARNSGPINDKYAWLIDLESQGLVPTMRVLKCFRRKQDAYNCEASLIAALANRRELVNASKGYPNWRGSFGQAPHTPSLTGNGTA